MATTRVARSVRRHPGTLFVIPGPHPGLIIPGNLNLWARPVIRNPNGSYSTVSSVSYRLQFRVDGRDRWLEVLMPEAFGSRTHTGPEALAQFRRTGGHLGMFDTADHANRYGDRLHLWFVANKKWFVPPRRR
jgi:hypothetical protein